MAILVQRDFVVAGADQSLFEQKSSGGVWPAFLRFGALMVGFCRWTFGERADLIATHTVYQDFEHWSATRMNDGAFYHDEAMLAETKEFREVMQGRNKLIRQSTARVLELLEGPAPRSRRAGEPVPDAPVSFGRGSVIAETNVRAAPGGGAELLALLRRRVWPWLGSQGARLAAAGLDLTGGELVTLVAYPSLEAWRSITAAPSTGRAPAEVVQALRDAEPLATPVRGRVGTIATDWGAV